MKIGKGYHQAGYGRGFKKQPIVYLLDNGKAYAKDARNYHETVCDNKYVGYVPVNILQVDTDGLVFYQCWPNKHKAII